MARTASDLDAPGRNPTRRSTRLSAAEIEAARAMWESGEPTRVVAARLGRSKSAALRLAARSGWIRPDGAGGRIPARRSTRPSAAELAAARAMWERGEPTRAVADRFGYSTDGLIGLAARLDWRRPEGAGGRIAKGRSRRPTAEELEAARIMWERGDATWFVAERLGYAESGLRGLVERLGWERPEGYHERLRAVCRWQPTPDEVARFTAMWERGETGTTFYLEFGVSWRAVANAARRLGLASRSRAELDAKRRRLAGPLGDAQARVEAVAKLMSHGIDRDLVAEHVGVARSSLRALVDEARRQGLLTTYSRRSWTPGPREIAIVTDGLRLGVFFATIGRLIDEERPITADAVRMLGRRLGLVPRNRFALMRWLSPEQLLAAERQGIDPADRVQQLWRNTLALDEERALAALADHVEAFERFPALHRIEVPLRPIRSFSAPRPPNPRIDACRGRFLVTEPAGDPPCARFPMPPPSAVSSTRPPSAALTNGPGLSSAPV